MEDFLEMFGIVAAFTLFYVAFAFWTDPEETMNRIGRCIAAFRRGLDGQTIERKTQERQSEAFRD